MKQRPSIDDIINAACAATAISRPQFHGVRRPAHLAYARQIAAHVAHVHGYSYPQIGRAFGRDHTTVLHSVRKIEALRDAGHVGIVAALARVQELAASYAAGRVPA